MTAADGRRTWRDRRRWLLSVPLVLATAACSAGEAAPPPFVGVPETVAIGGMPGPLSDTTVPTLPEVSVESTTTTTEVAAEPISGPLVDEVRGHRVLLIGDTALAVATPRAGGIMCDVVTGFGWDLAIEAEPGRSLAFADEVLDARLPGEWDVVGLMLGHHVEDTVDDFERRLDDILDRLDPRPIILMTVAELGDDQVAINRVLRERQRSRPNVVLLDWAEATSLEPDVLLDDGGPAASEEGAGRLALFTAALLSDVPGDEVGTCLEPLFTDDSAIVL